MTADQTQTVFHVTNEAAITRAKPTGVYDCESLAAEGFIHCCKKDQLSGVLERYYQGVTDLQVMEIDTAKLQAELVFENTVGGEELFPHIYGKINMDAVVDVVNL